MKIIRNPELKGILALFGVAVVLGFILLALTGTFTDWTGIRLTLKKPLTDIIVFVSDRNEHQSIWVMNPDGSDQKPLVKSNYKDSDPVIAPDGYSVAFVSRLGTEQNQIYVMDADGSHRHRITKITGNKSNLRFSPDGKEILFLCAGEVWRVGSRGQMPQRVLPTEHEAAMNRLSDEKSPCIWAERSYDGKMLAAVRSTGDGELVVLLKSGDEIPKPVLLPMEDRAVPLSGEKMFAAWAPDENNLAIALNNEDGAGTLVIVDTETEDMIPVPVIGGGPMGIIAWSPDGNNIAFQALKRVHAAEYEPIGLIVLNLIEKQVQPLVDAPVTQFTWSSDSSAIAYVQDGDIYVVDVESGETKNLTGKKGVNSSPVWAPAE